MDECIKREALLADIDAAMEKAGMGYVIGQTMKRYIKRQPAADVVEVCRCRDCKYFMTNLEADIFEGNDTFCEHPNGIIEPRENDFCSYGERRTE